MSRSMEAHAEVDRPTRRMVISVLWAKILASFCSEKPYSTSLIILRRRRGCVVMLPGALWAFLLSSFLFFASAITRIKAEALNIGLGKCLCLLSKSEKAKGDNYAQGKVFVELYNSWQNFYQVWFITKMLDQILPCNPVNIREVLIAFLYGLMIIVLLPFSWKNL